MTESKWIDGKITISRINDFETEKTMEITIKDSDAVTNFLRIRMTPQEFALVLTGLAHCDCEFLTWHLERVGKKRIDKPFIFETENYDRKYNIQKAKDLCPKGWTPQTTFGSRGSFFTGEDGKLYVRTRIFKWVEKEN